MKSRLIVAILGIPVLIYILLSGGLLLLLFANVIIGTALYEFYDMMERSGKRPLKKLGMILGLSIPNFTYIYMKGHHFGELLPFVISLGVMLLIISRVLESRSEEASRDIGGTLLGVMYISFLFSHIIAMSFLQQGNLWILTAQIMVWVCDSFAYFVGLSTGRKFFRRGLSDISPKKSIEGTLGGIFFTVLTLGIIRYFFYLKESPLSLLGVLAMGIFVSVMAQIGDLGESLFKRDFKIKDSGNILGGHGGILDRFDSMIFVVPTMFYLLKILFV
ncbi:phosphatidate cytidylyltransferase [uncultured Ilyobacter sp.]|uniref:phosphatidate cytidylyltransferase n=1 Tax=uncultured Ilyobacter sp. TaxID=544433 RepID=UPI0029C6119E|nr:phosphatidate cytidylyltransferase [uncultured Ilyobacter sp.]